MSFCYRNKIRIVSIIILTLFAALFTSACGRTRDVNEVRQSRNVSRNSLLHSLSANRQTKHTEVSVDEVLPVISENEVKEGEEPDLEAWYTLMEGFEVFLNSRDMVYAYIETEGVSDKDLHEAVEEADILIEKIYSLDKDTLTMSEAAAYMGAMSDVTDKLTGSMSFVDPKTVDVLQIKEDLKGTMWIDDDANIFLFDENGKNVYIAIAGENKPHGGTYKITTTRDSIVFTLSIPELMTEISAKLISWSPDGFRFMDTVTGDIFYLTTLDEEALS